MDSTVNEKEFPLSRCVWKLYSGLALNVVTAFDLYLIL
jgi:hypothetical protein